MELDKVEMLPGVVIVEDDPKKIGRVKAIVPKLFDASIEETPEVLPWIYPLTMGRYQSYSKPRNGMKIWVINNKDNYHEYWYIPFFELCGDTQEIVNEDNEIEVVMNRNIGAGSASIYYTKSKGIVNAIGGYSIELTPNGDYIVKGANDNNISLSSDKICIGKNGAASKPAARGDEVKKILDKMINILSDTSKALMPDSFQASKILQQIGDINTDNISSDTVNVD